MTLSRRPWRRPGSPSLLIGHGLPCQEERRQRVQLARALAQEPEILFLDEPTNHLDLPHQIDLLERVRGLGLTTVTVIHDLDLAAAYADDLIVLDSGRMVAGGPASTVLTPDLVRDHFGVDGEVWSSSRRGFTWNGLQT